MLSIPAAPSTDRRITHLRKMCQSLNLLGEPVRSNVIHHIMVDDRHKTMFCGVPTAAWTSWVSFLVNVSADTAEPSPPYGHHLPVHSRNYLRNKHLRPLEDYFPDEIRLRFDTYFTFMVVRHPLKRPVSSYNNRMDINHVEAKLHWATISQQILEKYRYSPDSGQNVTVQPKNNNVAFAEYLRYVLDHFPQDRHWMPYIAACQPCSIRYDYIVKLESMKMDARDVFDRMGIPAERRYVPYLKGLASAGINTGEVYMKYLHNVSKAEYQRLLSTYSTDMKLFNYGEPLPLQMNW